MSNRAQLSQDVRQVYYLSMEFLLGRTLSNALLAMEIYEDTRVALDEMGLELDDLLTEENDPSLGNGGLGRRLAACFLDSMATLALPGRGYGIRYEYGIFKQNIVNGQQAESPDYWLEYGNPWEFPRHPSRYKVRFGGRLQHEGAKILWVETEEVLACTYDQIIPGFDTDTTNTLRLWSAQGAVKLISVNSIRETTSPRWKIKTIPKTSPAYSIPTIQRIPAANCGCGGIFSRLRHGAGYP